MRAELETLLENPFAYQTLRLHRKMHWMAGSLSQAP
jgi:hypothetical protein